MTLLKTKLSVTLHSMYDEMREVYCRVCKEVTNHTIKTVWYNISIARNRNNTKESCMKNPLSPVNGDELAAQSRSAGTGKKTKEENDAETAGGTRGCPVFMAVAE